MSDLRPTKKSKPDGVLKSALKKTKSLQEAQVGKDNLSHTVKSLDIHDVRSDTKLAREAESTKKKVTTSKAISKADKGKAKAIPDERQLPSSFKLIAGSYEKLLYGLEGSYVNDEDEPAKMKLELKPIFIFPAHIAYIKAVAASPDGGKWLATGSTDESIKIWDLRRRKEHGSLAQHEGMYLLKSAFCSVKRN